MKRYNSSEDLRLLSDSALESSLAGFWDWDMVTNEEYLSPRFKEMFGYSEDEMESSPEAWQKIAFKEDLPAMYESLEKHIASKGKIPFRITIRYHHKNGETVWVRCNGKVVAWGENGEPLRAIGCHVDISEEKESELQLKRIIEERDILLKEVHHRVKNNLQLLLSLSRLKDKEGKIETAQIEDSINSIAIAYDAIYKSDRFDNISMKKYFNQIVSSILGISDVTYKIYAVELEKKIDFLIPLGLIITELINNSLKHAFDNIESKQIQIDILTEGDDLIIKYSDNGVGFTDPSLQSIEDSESFGLSIITGLIDQLNGRIEFSNENGALTTIRIAN
ncbi:sensor histidine kinase [Crocinitomix catalasitica]|uniref:sensor histidine kinase n=1 Tax=Crocinitomix catalasitica TaxID=184607 RepID=UPI0004854E1B|nr:PAS domain-containing protein [Crocinitomix catalasitica]